MQDIDPEAAAFAKAVEAILPGSFGGPIPGTRPRPYHLRDEYPLTTGAPPEAQALYLEFRAAARVKAGINRLRKRPPARGRWLTYVPAVPEGYGSRRAARRAGARK